ncbi:MAG TPA: SusC/RagA family TonB-linked outer membrane protein [Longimicrobiaceae bacterium]|nr:SusC/RagA family TonB-linked outer membrane protein [Longimicrobiaceae bacterium]
MLKTRWLFAGIAAVAMCTTPAAAQQGIITGRVVDATTQAPLSDVQVVLEGTGRGTLTDPDGRYRLADVAAGSYEIRATRIGYNGGTQQVSVGAGATITANFALETSAVSLDAIVVTSTGAQQKREVANAISNINADEIVDEAPVSNISELLTGRAAGVNILQSSGTVGTSTRIRIRGATSLSLSNQPIIIVDGARVNNSSDAFSIGIGGQTLGALNDINPQTIESIEIVKGPSAATLYGTDAANGVIVITTKQGGASGGPRWNAYVEQGLTRDVTTYPENFLGITAADSTCFAAEVGSGACVQDELLSYQPLNDEEVDPFEDGWSQLYGLSVAGGGEGINYFFSGQLEDVVGVYGLSDNAIDRLLETRDELPESRIRPNSLENISLRANVGADIADGLRLSVNSAYVTGETFFPPNDNNALGVLPSGLLGYASKDEGRFGYGYLLPGEVFAQEVVRESDRLIGSANLFWEPSQWDWFTGRATLGLDNTSRHDQYFAPVGQVPLGNTVLGSRSSNRIDTKVYTADFGGTAEFTITPDLTSRSSAGVQYNREFVQGTYASGEELGPGTKSVSSAAQQFADEATSESITLGTYLEQQFGWKNRLFVTGGIRFDDNSAFGQEFDLISYPKIGVSYVVLDEQGEPFYNVVNSLRIRGAWGASGRAPGATDALTFFDPATATIQGTDVPAITFGSLGNVDLQPESSKEVELGLDAGFLDGRVGLGFTWYRKTTSDILVETPLPPSLGVSDSRFANLGSVENRGWEIEANATLLEMQDVGWDFNFTASSNENELEDLGLAADSILIGTNQRFQEGYPLGAFFGREVSFEDLDDNGIISTNEVTVAETPTFIGPAFPETQISLRSTLTLFDLVRLSGLMDYRGGFYQYNNTAEFRCGVQNCRGLFDTSAPLDIQARALQTQIQGARSAAPFIEDATFWKLREISVTLLIPNDWAQRIGSSNASLVFSGRNLGTWTDYTGTDPEMNSLPTTNFNSYDFLGQPPARSFTLRLNLGF